jgi:hypothetical protein
LGYFLQDYASRSLRISIYWAGILNDYEAYYSAHDCEALVVVETVSRV